MFCSSLSFNKHATRLKLFPKHLMACFLYPVNSTLDYALQKIPSLSSFSLLGSIHLIYLLPILLEQELCIRV